MAKISELPFHLHSTSLGAPFLRSRFRLFCATRARNRRYPWEDEISESSKTLVNSETVETLEPKPSRAPEPPWLQKWSDPKKKEGGGPLNRSDSGGSSIERIVHRLRNLGLDKLHSEGESNGNSDLEIDDDIRLGDLLERSWNRPDSVFVEEQATLLPWEREHGGEIELEQERKKSPRARAPTMAELTIEDSELRRLRRMGIQLKERISVAKAGVTQVILEKIHDSWRKSELVRLKFHESLASDMKTAHEIVERRTGGLVIWRSGSVMIVYRGVSYQRPSKSALTISQSNPVEESEDIDSLLIPDASSSTKSSIIEGTLSSESNDLSYVNGVETMTEEEKECDKLLDELGPRFLDWWGTGILPVDADLLPQNIQGYVPPFRLLPTGMRSRLTNAEMTNLRKLARTLPSHFALGRNRNHQGLAAAILKLWESSLVAKIAVKRGIQNTNNKIMAEEIKNLTGGVLLLRNKYYIVIYRGKDFLPTSVAVALIERQELAKDVQDLEEKVRTKELNPSDIGTDLEDEDTSMNNIRNAEIEASFSPNGHALAGTLAEFQEAQAQWGREVTVEEQEQMKQEVSRIKISKMVKRLEHKLSLAEAKKLRAEKLLAKIESSMVPLRPSDDFETISEEERSVFRRIGLRMKAYLPLGIRGVFDGVIENMHLHWKHRELVKLISKQKTLAFVEDSARLLEYESGGILVAIERVPKGYALIYYRGKNYQRPINLRPRNLLTKAKALKRSVAMQRHEGLSQHIYELEQSVEKIKSELGDTSDVGIAKKSQHGGDWSLDEDVDFDSLTESDDKDDEDGDDYFDENDTEMDDDEFFDEEAKDK